MYTLFIESQADTELPVFKYISIVLLLWGAWRLYSDFKGPQRPANRPEERVGPPPATHDHVQETHKPHHQSHGHVQQSHEHVQSHQHVRPTQQHPSHVAAQHSNMRCPQCHKMVHRQSKNCFNCGFQFY